MWTITFFEKGFMVGLKPVGSEMVQVRKEDGTLIKFPNMGNADNSWIAADGRKEKMPLPNDLAHNSELKLRFTTFPDKGEAYQVIMWDNNVVEKVHYDDSENVHIQPRKIKKRKK